MLQEIQASGQAADIQRRLAGAGTAHGPAQLV